MNRDIRIVSEEQCTGCGACENICPMNAVALKEGKEGFLYPVIQTSRCIQCGKCKEVCPGLKKPDTNRRIPKCRAAYGEDKIRRESSSGAVFTLLSEYVLEKGGAVYGVVLDEQFQAIHVRVTRKEELAPLRRSKYVQSNVGFAYRQIKEDLKAGSWVLFSGTPCQNAALRKFLGKEEERLLQVDLVCHGVPSQKSFDAYLKETYPKAELKEFLFRIKDAGHNCMVSRATLKDGTVISNTADTDLYEKGFHQSLFLRKSCEVCPFAEPPRQGDVTIGDFWKLEEYNPAFTDPLGVSLVFLNNEKADHIWAEIRPKLKFDEPIPPEFALSHNRVTARIDIHPNRERFFELWQEECFSVAARAALEGRSVREIKQQRQRELWEDRKRNLSGRVKRVLPQQVKDIGKKILKKK